MKELYFSIDIETDGQVPGLHSMIQLGCCVISEDGLIRGTFSKCIKPEHTAYIHRATYDWWHNTPKKTAKYNDIIAKGERPDSAMIEFYCFIKNQIEQYKVVCKGEEFVPIVVAWKPGFDMAFVRYYMYKYIGYEMFGDKDSTIDIKTLTALALGVDFTGLHIADVPREWFGWHGVHNHDALDDAHEQARVFLKAMSVIKNTIICSNKYLESVAGFVKEREEKIS